MPFNFGLLQLSEWAPETVGALVKAYETALPKGSWPNWILGNHDNPRIANRVGPDRVGAAQMLLLPLRGTPTCNYGDEIGMQDVEIPPERVQDPQSVYDSDQPRPGAYPYAMERLPERRFLPE